LWLKVNPLTEPLIDEYANIKDQVVLLRRTIHENPELSYHEKETAALIASTLRSLGISVHEYVGGTGVLGILEGGHPGNVVALRADMDALPVVEENDVPFKSSKNGVMHACGHDSHVAMLLGAAMLLSRHKDQLHGTVKFLFQPAEEDGGRGGALPMIEAGVMENPKVDYVFGLHVFSNMPAGMFATRPGPIMAAPDHFKITIRGKGGHGSEPHATIDPVFISAQLISGLQGISSRMINQTKPFVLTVASVHAGSKNNIIPDNAVLEGTIRTLDEETRERAKSLVSSITSSLCSAFGAGSEVEFIQNAYPVTINDPIVTKEAIEILKKINSTIECEPILAGEDFSRFLQKAPGTFYFLGTRNEEKRYIYANHSSRFNIDEDIMAYGSASLARLSLHFGAKKK